MTLADRNEPAALPWWVIHSDDIIAMLERAHDGEEPGALLAEWYANSEQEQVEAKTPTTHMVCAYCGTRKPWPDSFPVRYEATCDVCIPDPNPMPRLSLLPWRKRR